MVHVPRTSRLPVAHSLVSRLLLAAAPVALVVVLLVGRVAAPLLGTPGDLDRAERDLLEVQRYQSLLSLVDSQTMYWSEYQYLPPAALPGVRDEITTATAQIASLRKAWVEAPASAAAAFHTMDLIDGFARTSTEAVDAGRSKAALQVLTGQVLPLSGALVDDLQGDLLDRSDRLGETFAELSGNLQAALIGSPLANRLRVVRQEIDQVVELSALEDLIVREASEYTQLIATGKADRLDAAGLATLVDRNLARLSTLVDTTEPDEQRDLAALARSHTAMTGVGEDIRVLVRAGRRAEAARLFEQRLDPILLDQLLSRLAEQVAGDQEQLMSEIAVVDERARDLRTTIALGALLLVLVLVFPIVLIGRSTVRPLRRIRRAAEEVAAGDLTARTGLGGRSEVAELAQSFDAMAARVEESRASLMSTTVLEASSDLLLVVRDGVVRYASGASRTLLGAAPESLLGQPLLTLVHPEDATLLAERTGAVTADHSALQVRFVRSEGWVDTEIAMADLRADPEVGGLALSIRDVTERKQAEIALADARDAALEASRLKSSFLATMSHEIRTPMNGVIGLTGLLLTTELDERQAQYAQGVRGAGEALLAIINDILDFSKVEAGKLELEEIDFDLVQVVEEAAVLVADAAQQKGVELLAYSSPDLPLAVRGDPSRIRQVLLNLVSNAVKFTEHGEVVVRAHLEDRTGTGVLVRFEVTDTGAGIPEPIRQHLFDPFTQADSSTTREFGGTGLGLAISQRLVSAMGGQIGLDSEVGQGSTFWFSLPLGPALEPTRSVKRHTGSLTGLRALIVDDNETNRLILTEQLGAWGMRTKAVAGGELALAALREAVHIGDPYDLALLDYCMPHMDGLDLAGQISQDATLATTGLVLLTSAADVTPERASVVGIAQTLTKPVRLSLLNAALQNVHGQSPERRTAPVKAAPAPRAGSRGHLLVVEDNTTNQLVAVGILDSLGFSAEIAGNGLEALQALARTSFAAVLMDCHMPVMDGYTATRQIRQDEGDVRHTPVIAMTAGAVQGDREQCLAAGMDDYVSKPVDPQVLDEVLTRWLPAPERENDQV